MGLKGEQNEMAMSEVGGKVSCRCRWASVGCFLCLTLGTRGGVLWSRWAATRDQGLKRTIIKRGGIGKKEGEKKREEE